MRCVAPHNQFAALGSLGISLPVARLLVRRHFKGLAQALAPASLGLGLARGSNAIKPLVVAVNALTG